MSGKEGGGGQPPNLPTLGGYVSSIQTGLHGGAGSINSTASGGPMLSQAPPLGTAQQGVIFYYDTYDVQKQSDKRYWGGFCRSFFC